MHLENTSSLQVIAQLSTTQTRTKYYITFSTSTSACISINDTKNSNKISNMRHTISLSCRGHIVPKDVRFLSLQKQTKEFRYDSWRKRCLKPDGGNPFKIWIRTINVEAWDEHSQIWLVIFELGIHNTNKALRQSACFRIRTYTNRILLHFLEKN